jgi:hypothetical protein
MQRLLFYEALRTSGRMFARAERGRLSQHGDMKFLVLFAVAGILAAQVADISLNPPKRVFTHAEATVTIIKGDWGENVYLHTGADIEADTAIIDIFYRYESQAFQGTDGKPAKLLLSVRVTCPVFRGIDSGCDRPPYREGFSLEAIEFVRIKYLSTTREIDHIKPE